MESIKLFSKEFHQNPYDHYKNIRPHHPFAKVNLVNENFHSWMAFSYEAATAVLKDERFIKDIRNVFPDAYSDDTMPPIAQSMLFVDPPDHRRLRQLVQRGFTPKHIARLRGRVEEIAREESSKMRSKKQVDFIQSYAFPIPIRVICELLGVPAEDQRDFQRWSNVMVDVNEHDKYEQSTAEFMDYLARLFELKRQSPQEDLLSELIHVEEEEGKLTTNELFGVVMLLIVAGHETTVNLISNGLLALLTHPEQFTLLKEDYSLIPQAIEELLRYNGPVEFSTDRWARESFQFMGQQVNKGDHVIVSLASADHDQHMVDAPDTLDITREKSSHLAFGKGIHYCLGAPLARLEADIAFRVLLEDYPNISLAADLSELEWRQSYIIRGLKELPVRLG
ncbi:cytochrome P450 family protein [Gracilibacillus salinarum]|uniref:Cytochrome P450 n=1 Tax=Gracilibacillus salinarum TaxID=2932255 RepID=A0ABY4GJB3_9BACI|nr:cytochrome P450 [Gracilibacillus salinarum]UOQ84446.1 cytochrome P450 [Gracilibacillus salinarum]